MVNGLLTLIYFFVVDRQHVPYIFIAFCFWVLRYSVSWFFFCLPPQDTYLFKIHKYSHYLVKTHEHSHLSQYMCGCLLHAKLQEDIHLTSVNVDRETNCWGCGLRVLVPPRASVFKCGWCGAITKQNVVKSDDNYTQFRRLRDLCFVSIVLLFILCFTCKHGCALIIFVEPSCLSHHKLLCVKYLLFRSCLL